MTQRKFHPLRLTSLAWVLASTSAFAAEELASYALDTQVCISSEQRTRGTSDSLNGPSAKLAIQWAHESGASALVEFNSVSKKQFQGGNGTALVLALGYRGGNPEGWHYGAGVVTEFFPGAGVETPHRIDPTTLEPSDLRRTRFNSAFAALELGWNNLEVRLMNVISKTYRGIDTGTVCGTLLSLRTDPSAGLSCYGRGDRNSRGSLLLDVSYKYAINPTTTLIAHVGRQHVRNFEEANLTDLGLSLKHQRWGYEWAVDWVSPRAKARELYLVQDGTRTRATDSNRVVVSVARKF